MHITVRSQPTKKDMQTMARYRHRVSRHVIRIVAIALLAFVSVSLEGAIDGDEDLWYAFWFYVILELGLAAAYLAVSGRFIRGEIPANTYIFGYEGVTLEIEDFALETTQISYADIRYIIETPGALYLCFRGMRPILVVTRDMPPDEQLQLSQQLAANLPEHRFYTDRKRLSFPVRVLLGVGYILAGMLALICFASLVSGGASDSASIVGWSTTFEPAVAEQEQMLRYYDTLDLAVGEQVLEHEITRLTGETALLLLSLEEMEDGVLALREDVVLLDGDRYSAPLFTLYRPVHGDEQISGKIKRGETDQHVVTDLEYSYRNQGYHQRLAGEFGDGNVIYYGIGTDPALLELTILGEAPDEVFTAQYGGETVYLWYYSDGAAFTRLLEEAFSAEFTVSYIDMTSIDLFGGTEETSTEEHASYVQAISGEMVEAFRVGLG